MTRRLLALATLLAAIAVIGLAPLRYANDTAHADQNWFSLFDGETLANWNQIGTANWRLEGAPWSPTAATAFWSRKSPMAISS